MSLSFLNICDKNLSITVRNLSRMDSTVKYELQRKFLEKYALVG